MARTKRAQILMDPRDYSRLARIAQRSGSSVGELIRQAVRERYLATAAGGEDAVERICRMRIPVGDWADVEAEIAGAHGDGVP